MRFYIPGTEESNDLWTHVEVTVIYLRGRYFESMLLFSFVFFFKFHPLILALLRDLTCPVSIIIVVFLDSFLYKERKFLFINSFEI